MMPILVEGDDIRSEKEGQGSLREARVNGLI